MKCVIIRRVVKMNESTTLKRINFSAIGLDEPGLVSRITNAVYEINGNIIRMEEYNKEGL